MRSSLNTTIINPISKKKPQNAVILCHGYGGDGKDISLLANYWKTFLPDTIFLCPDGPEKCEVSPTGFQWFTLTNEKPELILSQSLKAEMKLNKFIDEVKSEFNLTSDKIALVGFSQGCMLSIQTGVKRKDSVRCIIGYSGRIIDLEHLRQNINSRPEILLMHGDKDEVVSVNSLLEAKDFFSKNNYKIETKIFENCEHRIPSEGSSLGLQFAKKNLY